MTGFRRLAFALFSLTAFTGLALAADTGATNDGGNGGVRGWIAGMIEKMVNGPNLTVSIGAISGAVPFNFTIDRVTVADRDGVWLTLDQLHLNLALTALVTGRAKADAIEAQRVIVARAPVSDERQSAPEPSQPTSYLPSLPVGVQVDRLAIAQLRLGEPLLGQAATLRVDGALDLASHGKSLSAKLAVDRIDQQPGRATLDALYDPDKNTLDLALNASEPAGGLMARAASIPGLPPVSVSLNGKGSLDDWSGALTATAESTANVAASATIKAVPEGHAVDVAVSGDVMALLDAPLAPLVGPRPILRASVVMAPDGGLTLRPVVVEAAAGTATLNGTVAADHQHLALRWEVAAGPDSALHGLMPTIGWKDGTVTGSAEGPLDRLTVAVQAVIHELAAEDPTLAPLAGPEVRLDGKALVGSGDGTVTLDGLTLTTAAATAKARGTVKGWGQTADLTVALNADDLSRLSAIAGMPLGGSATLGGPVRRTAAGAVTTELKGAVRDLATGTAADALLGKAATLAATLAMDPDGAMRVGDLTVDGADGRLTGTAELAKGRVQANTRLEVRDLAPVGVAMGMPMAGAAALDARVTGPLDALEATATLDARKLEVRGRRFGATTVTASAAGLPSKPNGSLSAKTELGPGLTASGGYALNGQMLSIDRLVLNSGPNQVTGAVTVALDSMTANGRLKGDLPRLKAFSELAGMPLDGSAGFTVALDAKGGKQAATLTADASNLKVEGQGAPLFAARRLTINADVADALNIPRGKARVELRDGAAAGQALSRVTASLDGSLAKADFQVAATGTTATGTTDARPAAAEAKAEPVALDLAGSFQRENGLNRVRLDRLQGRYLGQPFRLTQSATATFGADRYEVSGLRLVSDAATLLADLGLRDGKLSGDLRLDRVPMALARLANPSLQLDGTLNARATLGGTLRKPNADATLSVVDLKARQASQAGVPGLDATVNARWRDQRVAVDGHARSSDGSVRLTMTAAAPLALNPDTMAVSAPPRGVLSAAVNGTVDMALANDILATSGDRARGALRMDVKVDGTVGSPRLGGEVTLTGGRYENRASGAIISDIDARIVGTGDVFSIEHFSGRTANGGAVGISGVIRPGAADPQQQIDLRVQADNARLVRNDLAIADVGMNLTVTGSFIHPRLAGPIRILSADIQIPSQTPPDVVDLKVINIGKGYGGGAAKQQRKAAADAPFAMALNLTVTADNQIFVRGRGLEAEFSAHVGVAGTSTQPIVTGQLTMLKGTLGLLGQTFAFQHGNILFDGGTDIDPRLDLLAEATANNVTADVQISGTAQHPSVALTSPQGLPQDEVLAGVLFGKSVSNLTAAEAVQLAQSAAALTGFGGGGAGLLDQVRRSLGVDRLEVSSGSVQAGRYVSKRVYVGVEQGIGANQSRATVQVDITKGIKAEATAGADSETRVGLKWEHNY